MDDFIGMIFAYLFTDALLTLFFGSTTAEQKDDGDDKDKARPGSPSAGFFV